MHPTRVPATYHATKNALAHSFLFSIILFPLPIQSPHTSFPPDMPTIYIRLVTWYEYTQDEKTTCRKQIRGADHS